MPATLLSQSARGIKLTTDLAFCFRPLQTGLNIFQV
ncbi:Uncharacterised protein [Vibrio cholerae]|nr:Uncharacterised protein [Vibrio cholerae]